MKKIVWTIITFLVPVLLCTGCNNPPIESVVVQNVSSYLQVNDFVAKTLEEQFSGILPPEDLLDEVAYYEYSYNCAIFGDPNFLIYLENTMFDVKAFSLEHQRVAAMAKQRVSVTESKSLYIVSDLNAYDLETYTDDKIYDGFDMTFEMAVVDEDSQSIAYLVALQQDSNTRPEIILSYLKLLSKTGDGSAS